MKATKHDIEVVMQMLKQNEKDSREKHKEKLVNGETETVWSSYFFGYAEGISSCLKLLNKII